MNFIDINHELIVPFNNSLNQFPLEIDRIWKDLEREKKLRTVSLGENIFKEGEEGTQIGYLLEGSLSRRMNNGGLQNLLAAVMVPGDFLGIESLFQVGPFQSTYVAREKSRVCLFSNQNVREKISLSSQLSEYFLRTHLLYMEEILTHLQVLSNKSLQSRVAAGILYFSGKLGTRPWTNKELAAWAGVTQEGVGRSFTHFLSEGIIRKEGRRTQVEKKKELEVIASTFKTEQAPRLVSFLLASCAVNKNS